MDYKVKPPPEWEKIAAQAKNDSQLTLLVKAWLESNRTSAVAGAVLSKLIETIGKEDTDIVEESALWLQDHYADDAAPVLIGQMLEASYSDRFVSFAKQCLRSPKKLRQLRPLIQAVQDGVIHGELFEVVGELLEQNPFDNDWQHGLRYWQDSKLAEDLVCRWIADRRILYKGGWNLSEVLA